MADNISYLAWLRRWRNLILLDFLFELDVKTAATLLYSFTRAISIAAAILSFDDFEIVLIKLS